MSALVFCKPCQQNKHPAYPFEKKRKTFDVLTSKRLLGKPLFVYHFLDDRRDYSKGQ